MKKILCAFLLLNGLTIIAQESERKVEKFTSETKIRSIGPELEMEISSLPVYGQIRADFKNLNPEEVVLVNVYDMTGAEVYADRIDEGIQGASHVFDFKALKSGEYILRVTTVSNNAKTKISI